MVPKKNILAIKDKTIALIIDGFINGFGIIRSLKNNDIFIVVLCKKGSPLSYSKHCDLSIYYSNKTELDEKLLIINKLVNKAIPFYCSDLNLKTVLSLKEKLSNFSIYSFNPNLFNKNYQQNIANSVGIKVPKTYIIKNKDDIKKLSISNNKYIIKPDNLKENTNLFKTKITNELSVLKKYAAICTENNAFGLISEYIPGGDTSLYTYGGYAYNGELIVDFTGRKISQRPRFNGVASMAESITNNEIPVLGKNFISEINFTGIFQIEFKKDEIGNYYFIEFNPRNWSWGFVATVNGNNLALAKYAKESNLNYKYKIKGKVNFYLWAEGLLYNIVLDKWFSVVFVMFKQLFKTKVTFAILSLRDPLPFIFYIRNTVFYFLRIKKELR